MQFDEHTQTRYAPAEALARADAAAAVSADDSACSSAAEPAPPGPPSGGGGALVGGSSKLAKFKLPSDARFKLPSVDKLSEPRLRPPRLRPPSELRLSAPRLSGFVVLDDAIMAASRSAVDCAAPAPPGIDSRPGNEAAAAAAALAMSL